MDFKKCRCKLFRISYVALILFLALNLSSYTNLIIASPSDFFSYEFIVDRDGLANTTIIYTTSSKQGTSWVLVPKYLEWTNRSIGGKITKWSLNDAESLTGSKFYFYEAFSFSFESDGTEFKMIISFNFTMAALIIEPEGIFYSPQIGFKAGKLTAKVTLPEGFRVSRDQALVFGSYLNYKPSSYGSNYVFFGPIESENLVRIEVGFRTTGAQAEHKTLKSGIFTFNTISRYKEYAEKILDLFNRTYDSLVSLFNVTLDSAEIQFFLPDFYSLFSVMGYVPFISDKMGNIHINIFSIRYVEGYMEITALHELIHHFIWKAGISPEDLLWFHEGMAQYISVEIAQRLGYEGAAMVMDDLESLSSQLLSITGGDFGFLQQWSPEYEPQNIQAYYVASYYVVSRLAENRGGLNYYARFFKLIKGERINDNSALTYYLSLAANESVIQILNNWGFVIPDVFAYPKVLVEAKSIIDQINPIFQPFRYIAEFLYRQAVNSVGNSFKMQVYLAAAILIARLAPLLMLVMISAIIYAVALLVLKRKGVFSSY